MGTRVIEPHTAPRGARVSRTCGRSSVGRATVSTRDGAILSGGHPVATSLASATMVRVVTSAYASPTQSMSTCSSTERISRGMRKVSRAEAGD